MAAQIASNMQELKVSKSPSATKPSTRTTAPNEHKTGESDSSGDDEEAAPNGTNGTAPAKKKKKKRRPKKKKPTATLNDTAQSTPPRVPVFHLFPSDTYPVGQEAPYLNTNSYRTTSEEKRALDRSNSTFLAEYRQAAEIHRQVRQYAQQHVIKPGRTLTEIAEEIEEGVRALTGHDGLTEGDGLVAGMGFPTGLSINNCAAHYTPNAGNKVVYQAGDVMKVDFGVHVNGRILDSAFTVCTDEKFKPLLQAAREATEAGVREAGIDVRMCDVGAAIQEVMESFEVAVSPGKMERVKSIRNLNGHDIIQYKIHGGKSVPIVRTSTDQTKMEEGETFAIETFGSTGKGYVNEDMETSHYSKARDISVGSLKLASAKSIYSLINKNFGTLPFCRRYLDRLGAEKYQLGLNSLVGQGVVQAYPPLCDVKGSYTAQFEHTILLRPTCKEIVSRGDDY